MVIQAVEKDKTYDAWAELSKKDRERIEKIKDPEVKEQEIARIQRITEQTRKFANMLDGHITRKVVKQTVMTSVYGVTFVGARKQIQARLEERNIQGSAETSEESEKEMYQVANYVARTTLDQMNMLFKGARDIMVRQSSEPPGMTAQALLPTN